MTEQIINWWNSLPDGDKIFSLFSLLAIIMLVGFGFLDWIISYLKNKRKTITQRFKEGLIKK